MPNNAKRCNIICCTFSFVGILGLEPRMTGPESVVLPLHHIPMFLFYQPFVINFPIASAKVLLFFELQTISATFL